MSSPRANERPPETEARIIDGQYTIAAAGWSTPLSRTSCTTPTTSRQAVGAAADALAERRLGSIPELAREILRYHRDGPELVEIGPLMSRPAIRRVARGLEQARRHVFEAADRRRLSLRSVSRPSATMPSQRR